MSERIKREIKAGLKRRSKKEIELLRKLKRYGSIAYKRDYYRIKIRKRPRKAQYRYLDIGKPRGHQLLRVKVGKKWRTYEVLVEKKSLSKETLEIVKKAKKYQA